jgi:hypothetical protein
MLKNLSSTIKKFKTSPSVTKHKNFASGGVKYHKNFACGAEIRKKFVRRCVKGPLILIPGLAISGQKSERASVYDTEVFSLVKLTNEIYCPYYFIVRLY